MRKKLLFLTSMLLLFATSCQKEFSAERARELTSLHANASDYTESEIKEIEAQMELYLNLCESKINDALSEKDTFQRQRKIAKLGAWFKADIETVDTMTKLTRILNGSSYADKKKMDSFRIKVDEVIMTIELIQKDMRNF